MKVIIPVLVLFCLVAVPLSAWGDARMTFVGEKSTYAEVGLRTGDIVLNVDGKVPASAGEVSNLIFAALRRPGVHKIEIRRGGEFMTLTFGK